MRKVLERQKALRFPLGVLYTEKTVIHPHRQNHQWIEKTEVHHWWWLMTLPKSRLSTRLLWYIAHRRWEIENELYHTLVAHWSLDHHLLPELDLPIHTVS